MYKIKIEAFDHKRIIENTYIEHLEQYAQEGWILTASYMGFMFFKKEEPQDIKYQIEYQAYLDYEYEEYLLEEGYELVLNYDGFIIFKNKNMDASDLHSDEEVKLEAINKNTSSQIKASGIAIALTWFPLYLILSFFTLEPINLGWIFENFLIILFILFLIVLLSIPIILLLKFIFLKRIVKQIMNGNEPNFTLFNITNKITKIFSYIYALLLMIAIIFAISRFLNNPLSTAFQSIYHIIIIIVMLKLVKLMSKYRINKKAILPIIILFIAIIVGVSQNTRDKYFPEEDQTPIPTTNAYMSEYDGYVDNNNILVNTITFTKNLNDELSNNNYKEEFKTCTNEFIAKEIMKNNIVHYENDSRATPEAIKELLDKTGEYVTGDIPYYSYEDAVNHLNIYNNVLVDECYYNSYFMIARKDKQILIAYMQEEDDYINNIINHYFKGEN